MLSRYIKSHGILHAVLITVLLLLGQVVAADEQSTDAKRMLFSAAESVQHVLSIYDKDIEVFAAIEALDASKQNADEKLSDRVVKVIVENSLKAKIVSGLTITNIRQLHLPVILMVQPAIEVPEKNHFVVLESVKSDELTIYAGSGQRIKLPLFSLSQLWNGDAILLAPDATGIQVPSSNASNIRFWISLVVILGVGMLVIGFIKKDRSSDKATKRLPKLAFQSIAVILIVVAAVILNHVIFHDQSLDDAVAQRAYASNVLVDFRNEHDLLSQIDVTDIEAEALKKKILDKRNFLFVDARAENQYVKNHIQGAILMDPITPATARLRLAGIPKDTELVVYCASISCGRGHIASIILTQSGFTNVLHFPQGWSELQHWKELKHVYDTKEPFGNRKVELK